MILIIISVMLGIIGVGIFAKLALKFSNQNPKQKKNNPPTYFRACSKWTPLLSGIILVVILYEIKGYPIVTKTTIEAQGTHVYYSQDGVNEASNSKPLEDSNGKLVELMISFDRDNSEPQEIEREIVISIVNDAKLKKPENVRHKRARNKVVRPRRKVCHRFFTDYFSRELLNNKNSHQIIGIDVATSRDEQRIPSQRPNPPLYRPPLVLMNSWSRAGIKTGSVRFRWGN